MFCIKCGRELEDEANFCPACGTKRVEIAEKIEVKPKKPKKPAKKHSKRIYKLVVAAVLAVLALSLGIYFLADSSSTKKAGTVQATLKLETDKGSSSSTAQASSPAKTPAPKATAKPKSTPKPKSGSGSGLMTMDDLKEKYKGFESASKPKASTEQVSGATN